MISLRALLTCWVMCKLGMKHEEVYFSHDMSHICQPDENL